MSLLGFLLKRKSEMKKPNTKSVRLRKFRLTAHAQNRIVERKRNLKKHHVVDNLYRKPLGIDETKCDPKGKPSYNRIGSYVTASINPINQNIVTLRRTNKRDAKKFKLERRGNRYVKKGQ